MKKFAVLAVAALVMSGCGTHLAPTSVAAQGNRSVAAAQGKAGGDKAQADDIDKALTVVLRAHFGLNKPTAWNWSLENLKVVDKAGDDGAYAFTVTLEEKPSPDGIAGIFGTISKFKGTFDLKAKKLVTLICTSVDVTR